MSAASEPHDSELAASAVAGDERAFSWLMQRHKDGLYRFIRRYTGDAEEAYDLLQESFTAAWGALKRYDRTRPFPTWLRRIALNKCRDWSRRRVVRRWLTRNEGLDSRTGQNLAADEPSPETNVSDQERCWQVKSARPEWPIPNPWIRRRQSRLPTPGPPGRAGSGDLVGRSGGVAD